MERLFVCLFLKAVDWWLFGLVGVFCLWVGNINVKQNICYLNQLNVNERLKFQTRGYDFMSVARESCQKGQF